MVCSGCSTSFLTCWCMNRRGEKYLHSKTLAGFHRSKPWLDSLKLPMSQVPHSRHKAGTGQQQRNSVKRTLCVPSVSPDTHQLQQSQWAKEQQALLLGTHTNYLKSGHVHTIACHRVVAFQLCFQNAPWPVLVNMDQKHNRKHPNNNLPLLIITSHAQKPSYYIQKYHQHHLNSQHTQSPPWLTLWTPQDHLTIHFTIAKEKSGNF